LSSQLLTSPVSHAAPAPPRLEVGIYRFHLRFAEPLTLPPFWGSTIRGLLGHALRQVHCVTGKPSCLDCPVKTACNYHWLFDTPELQENLLDVANGAPRPFVLNVPPPADKRHFRAGEALQLGFTLFGRALSYLPAIIPALNQMGHLGLGNHRSRFDLSRVERIWMPASNLYQPIPINGVPAQKARPINVPAAPPSVRVELLTPMRLRHKGSAIGPAHFNTRLLFANILRRNSLLSWYFSGRKHQADFRHLLALSEEMEMRHAKLRMYRWQRYSGRQHRMLQMNGLIGSFELHGAALKTLWPYLYLGLWTHAGKGTSLGLGRYRLLPATHLPGGEM